MILDFDSFEVLTFDCYGTIIDWETGILEAVEPILSHHGISLDRETILEFYGESETAIEASSYKKYSEVLRAVLVNFGEKFHFTPSAEELLQFPRSVRDWPAFPDSSQALKDLSSKYKLAILSNIDDELFEYSRRKLNIDFYKVFTAEQIGSYKPSLKNFEYLISHVGVPKAHILHVAQSLFHDIAPAKQCDLATVWVNRRKGQKGPGATPSANVQPHAEVPDLRSLARLVGVENG